MKISKNSKVHVTALQFLQEVPGENYAFTVLMTKDLFPDLKIEIGKVISKFFRLETNTMIADVHCTVQYNFWTMSQAETARRMIIDLFETPIWKERSIQEELTK